MRIDPTFEPVHFGYSDKAGNTKSARTLEEEQYPQYYRLPTGTGETGETEAVGEKREPEAETRKETTGPDEPAERHLSFQENQRGVSFDSLLGPYLNGARKIVLTDPYIRLFFQARNLMEFLETVAKLKQDEEEVAVHLVSAEDDFKGPQQREYFQKMQDTCSTVGITFTWEFGDSIAMHARHIVTDTGWKILLDRGLDIFQHYEMNDAFSISNRLQQYRPCKAFEVTFLRMKNGEDEPKRTE